MSDISGRRPIDSPASVDHGRYDALDGDGEGLEEIYPEEGSYPDDGIYPDDGSYGDPGDDGYGDAVDDGDSGEPGDGTSLEILLVEMLKVLDRAKSMPLSTSVLVDRDELRACVESALEALPVEINEARQVLAERRQLLAQAEKDADDLLDDARAQAEQMVQRTEITRRAHRLARDVEERARVQARELRREADDYCDRRLAVLERALGKSLKTLRDQREEMRRRLGEDESPEPSPDLAGGQGDTEYLARGGTGQQGPGALSSQRAPGDPAGMHPFDQDAG